MQKKVMACREPQVSISFYNPGTQVFSLSARSRNFLHNYKAAIRSAKDHEKILIVCNWFSDQDLFKTLVAKAIDRQLRNIPTDIEIIADETAAEHTYGLKGIVKDIELHGIQIYYRGKINPRGFYQGTAHEKFILIGTRILINGSANLTKGANEKNAENFVVLADSSEDQQRVRELFEDEFYYLKDTERHKPPRLPDERDRIRVYFASSLGYWDRIIENHYLIPKIAETSGPINFITYNFNCRPSATALLESCFVNKQPVTVMVDLGPSLETDEKMRVSKTIIPERLRGKEEILKAYFFKHENSESYVPLYSCNEMMQKIAKDQLMLPVEKEELQKVIEKLQNYPGLHRIKHAFYRELRDDLQTYWIYQKNRGVRLPFEVFGFHLGNGNLHNKIYMFDDEVALGSYNLSHFSGLNDYNNLMVFSQQQYPNLYRQCQNYIEFLKTQEDSYVKLVSAD